MKKEKSGVGAVAAALSLSLTLGAVGIGVSTSGVRIVPKPLPTSQNGDLRIGASTEVARYYGIELDPTEIYRIASNQSVAICLVSEDEEENETEDVIGTGFFVSYDGFILTNCHVVSDALKLNQKLVIRRFDGSTQEASVVGADTDGDVALLKVTTDWVSPVVFGNSDRLKACEAVYIMGHPSEELLFTMTSGIVSALDRTIDFSDGTTLEMFQVDAAVNPGNSGGPVYNRYGEVIGITTAKYSGFVTEGLGFAIPINDAVRLAEDLKQYGYVRNRPLFGITVTNAAKGDVAEDSPAGALIHSVEPGLCAEAAGLQVGDIIVRLGNGTVSDIQSLTAAKRAFHAGDTATVRFWRDGEYLTCKVTFDEVTPEHPTGTISLTEEEAAPENTTEPEEQPEAELPEEGEEAPSEAVG